MTEKMTKQERKAEFDRLFAGLPGKNIEKIDMVCGWLYCERNTVRGWCMAEPARVIPEAKLRILREKIAAQAVA